MQAKFLNTLSDEIHCEPINATVIACQPTAAMSEFSAGFLLRSSSFKHFIAGLVNSCQSVLFLADPIIMHSHRSVCQTCLSTPGSMTNGTLVFVCQQYHWNIKGNQIKNHGSDHNKVVFLIPNT